MRLSRKAAGFVGLTLIVAVATVPQTQSSVAAPSATTKAEKSLRSGLGNGLGRLVHSSDTAAKQAGGLRIDQSSLAIRDRRGRVLVDLTPQANVNAAAFRRQAEANGLHVRSVDRHFGTLEGFVRLGAVERLAALRGTGTIAQALKPHVDSGIAESQGVPFQRVDRVLARGVTGRGITIGALSDSYNLATTDIFGDPLKIHARQDVRSGDLPGRRNPENRQPVVVLQDAPGGLDEGRAMLQIAHDVAPKAKLCFATAEGGLVNFTNNVRALAARNGPCRANVVVDDVSYFDEPMFSDSILSDAIDSLSSHGVHYFSSAGNEGQQNSWQSRVRLVPKSAARNTNLDFSNVDPALYDGGLQDAKPGPGTDVAQTLTLGESGGTLDVQWDDPFDPNGTTFGAPFFKATGNITKANPSPSFAFKPTAAQVGKEVQFRTDAIPSGTTDLVLTVTAPDGTNLGTIDTGTSPEFLTTTLRQTGTYTITVEGFDGDTGDFTVDVRPVLSQSKVTTDFNVLLFDPAGNFLGALADVNPVSGRPIELSGLAGLPQVQMVISRSGTGPVGAHTIRAVTFDDIFFTEYSDPFAPAVFGHHTAAGGAAVAAYETFKPYLPEYFTSPGGHLPIYFDSNGNRFPRPQIRTVPLIASTDGGNTTFFLADTIRDPDTQPNFFGTSAAAPHAAAIAALVLAKHGGPHSVSPPRMRRILSRATFAHDLDPLRAQGSSHGLTLRAFGAQGSEGSVVPGSLNSRRFFTLSYHGSVPLKSVTLLGGTASPTADGLNPPQSDGIVFDRRPFDPTAVNAFDTVGFPFTIGSTSGGLQARDVSARYTVPGKGTAVRGQFRHLTLNFANGLTNGQSLRFGTDRDLALSPFHDTSEGNGADELGGATFIPSGRIVRGGLVFRAVLANGHTFRTAMTNRIGHGYSPIDGFGVVNAERAVFGP
jgi:hypothetical protein